MKEGEGEREVENRPWRILMSESIHCMYIARSVSIIVPYI